MVTFLRQGQIWENAGTYDFNESLGDLGLKTGIENFPNEFMKVYRFAIFLIPMTEIGNILPIIFILGSFLLPL